MDIELAVSQYMTPRQRLTQAICLLVPGATIQLLSPPYSELIHTSQQHCLSRFQRAKRSVTALTRSLDMDHRCYAADALISLHMYFNVAVVNQ